MGKNIKYSLMDLVGLLSEKEALELEKYLYKNRSKMKQRKMRFLKKI